MPSMQQNPDGTWTEAVPLDWQGPDNQVDWEVYYRPISRTWHGYAYSRDKPLLDFEARTKLGLRFKAWRAFPRRPHTFLWDQPQHHQKGRS